MAQARVELLDREKELTRLSDELARERQQLSWVAVEKECSFQYQRRNQGSRICSTALAAARLPFHARPG
jgi:predicted dithiol-disulfide oxidoreductase (DUF899 family)